MQLIFSIGCSHGDGIEMRRTIFVELGSPEELLSHRDTFLGASADGDIEGFFNYLHGLGVKVEEGPRGSWGMCVIDEDQKAVNAEARKYEESAHFIFSRSMKLERLALKAA